MSKSISWFCAETLPEQEAPKWKQSAGVDEKGEIYVPAIIAGEEKKIFFDSEWDDEPIAILDRNVRRLRTKEIKSVKVQWKHHPFEEATWETERDMREKYPQLFSESGTTSFLP